ncbi:hypothetical protein [Rhizorhabdus dicambivorans]|nr:hypothetical protein [Rhizorhabdus dicambivorans]
MFKINSKDGRRHVRRLRDGLVDAVKWWAEHQAWPATDDIRIDRHRSTCG